MSKNARPMPFRPTLDFGHWTLDYASGTLSLTSNNVKYKVIFDEFLISPMPRHAEHSNSVCKRMRPSYCHG
jgi:hypothetical protein